MNPNRSIIQRLACLLLCGVVVFGLAPRARAAQSKTFLLQQAQTMALAGSSDISKVYNQILLKKMKYVEAVEGIKAKVKNKTSFRWSPLLSFKFPEPLNMIEEHELNVKPLTLQAEIQTLQHQMDDLTYQVLADVNKLYTQAYISQEKIAFTQERLDAAQEQLERNQARLVTGQATQSDVDTMSKKVETLTIELSNLKRTFETEKAELTEMVGLDVTSGYTFRNSLNELAMPREMLESIITYTLDNDQTVYEARTTASTALMNLENYESLMRSQYGGKMDTIQGYINMVKQGQEVDYAAFQMKYEEFLTAIDRPWAGKIRILFFTFTMEWFKGEIDGSRYIEDEMYAVYTACMDYDSARAEVESTEASIRSQVESSYEALVSSWNAYQTLAQTCAEQQEELSKAAALNKLGQVDFTQVDDAQSTYQETQLEALDALASYNEQLYDFDRLTCGAVTKYMSGESLDMGAGEGGDSFSDIDTIDEPYYYIYTTVDDLVFHIGVSIPEDFEPAVNQFEVWSDGYQIGERTAIGEEISHLSSDYGGGVDLVIRLYNSDEYVTECAIDATVSRDVLNLQSESDDGPQERTIGSYRASTTNRGDLSTSELTININASEGAKSYAVRYGEAGVYSTDVMDLSQSFQYLTLLITSLEDVTLELYDADGALLLEARFDTELGTIVTDAQEGGA